MKIYILTLSIVMTMSSVTAQKNKISKEDSPDSNFYCFNIGLNKNLKSGKKDLPCKEIIVMDKRACLREGKATDYIVMRKNGCFDMIQNFKAQE